MTSDLQHRLREIEAGGEPIWSWDDVPGLRELKVKTEALGGDLSPDPDIGSAQYRKRRDAQGKGGSQRRFLAPEVHANRASASLSAGHPALTEARTIFRRSVRRADASPRVLVSGKNNSKIGARVLRGAWAGFPIFTLTLEERATCPTTCGLWRECMGNAMPFARRHSPGPELEVAIARELAAKQAEHPRGFAVRVHVLGDFYSLGYLKAWLGWMDDFPALHVWGYTAHPLDSAIGLGIDAANDVFPDRWAFRFSRPPEEVLPGGDRSYLVTTIWRLPEAEVVPEGVVCAAERDRSHSCGSCGLCWAAGARDKSIVFVGHGRTQKASAPRRVCRVGSILMERGQFILALAGGRARPSMRLTVPIRTITATIVGEPALCAHPDLPEPVSIQELCRALVRRGAPEAALQVVWPDRRPAMFVPSIRECAEAPA